MFRILATLVLAFLLLGSFARAQEFSPRLVAMAIANDLDAVTIECPVALTLTVACYRYSMDSDWHKMRLETFVRKHNDVEWMVPWSQEDGILMRAFRFNNGDEYIVFLMNQGSGSIGYVVHHDKSEEE